jgi:hypothetical protein
LQWRQPATLGLQFHKPRCAVGHARNSVSDAFAPWAGEFVRLTPSALDSPAEVFFNFGFFHGLKYIMKKVFDNIYF